MIANHHNICDVNENCLNSLTSYAFNGRETHKPIDTSIDGSSDGSSTPIYDYFRPTNRQDIYRLVPNTPTTSTRLPPPKATDPLTPPDVTRRPNLNQMAGNGAPLMTPESPTDSMKPFYVYYPNYSLPDLSFLQQILEDHSNGGQQKVYLSPTSHQQPDRDSVSVKMRKKSATDGSKRRLKSLNDFESFCKQNFNHVKDWDSLNILLPNEFKELIQKANTVSNTINEMSCDSHISEDSLESDTTPSNSVRMRSHRSSSRLSNNNNNNRNKRFSLQDYPYSRYSGHQTDCHTMSEHIDVSPMHRSVTMPNCHNSWNRHQRQHCCHNSCNCHQHCCHTSCHCHQRCCHQHSYCHSCGDRTPQHSPDKSYNRTSSDDMKSSSIDKLCHILATDLSLDLSSFDMDMSLDMDLTYDMDINGQNGWSNGAHPEKSAQRMPQNANNSVSNGNNRKVVEELPQKSGSDDGSNFKELKQRWESMATVSPNGCKSATNSPNVGLNRKVDNICEAKRVSNKANKTGVKPETPRKPQLVLRRPQSSIPRPTTLNTENPKRSQRKSMIPVPKGGQTKSPVYAKVKSNAGFKP